MYFAFQANSKFSQVQQNPAKPSQRKSKKKALIPFDFLVRIEAFQWVAPTPRAKKSFAAPFSAVGLSCPDAPPPPPE
jgi:hypothetical protein